MRESAGVGISIVSLAIDLFGDPKLLPRRPVLIPDQSANAADRKDKALAIHRHGSNPFTYRVSVQQAHGICP